MTPLQAALARADRGLDWSYPCLIWVADYVRDATGTDYAAKWRGVGWTEASAKLALARLAAAGNGQTAVERAIDTCARASGWAEADGPRQGAVMIGVFAAIDGVGIPAIFDGQSRWIVSNDGRGWTSTIQKPIRIWEILRAQI
ncbi:MAG: hypothetical protein WC829_02320 [Hyphomicrobium sp.]|jgi:hypothetical protein